MGKNYMTKFITLPFIFLFFLNFNATSLENSKIYNTSFSSGIKKEIKNFSVNPSIQKAATCFSKGSKNSGHNKICFYDCVGSEFAITIPVTSLCPLTIQN